VNYCRTFREVRVLQNNVHTKTTASLLAVLLCSISRILLGIWSIDSHLQWAFYKQHGWRTNAESQFNPHRTQRKINRSLPLQPHNPTIFDVGPPYLTVGPKCTLAVSHAALHFSRGHRNNPVYRAVLSRYSIAESNSL